eukprot:TRINITY_DN2962_c0_g3_i2.p2 TRINITY_DN2962_c0_g3~~TRINITY_DN2962_c0_g3_i2.p2  ORF type:complete len:121 (+),score=28.81 TRINITY_DN2962_c0_g3_i2:77-439(+)
MEIEVKKSWREKPILAWIVDDVVDWAKSKDGADIDEEYAEKLRQQKIKGKSLLTCTKEKFERWGIPGGPACDLFSAIPRGTNLAKNKRTFEEVTKEYEELNRENKRLKLTIEEESDEGTF